MRYVLATFLIAVSMTAQTLAEQELPLSDAKWLLAGERTAVVKEGGRDVLQLETGRAERRDVQFENGTIEFDVQVTRRRSFVYVYFRIASDGEREEFYLRPHKSGLPDAVQYAPVWQGRSAWQLHHGPGGTAAAPFTPGSWTRVRVIVQGRHAALFVGDMTTPALLVAHLAREPQPGHVGLGGFLPAGVPGEGPIAKFANVIIRPGEVPFDVARAVAKMKEATTPAEASEDGIVRAWSVSRSFVPKDAEPPALPQQDVTGEFRRLETEPNGLLELHHHVRVPAERGAAAVVARLHVRAAAAGDYAFDLGFSDIATVFVNGRPLYRGDQSYSFDAPRRDGLIGFDQARLYLPLIAGDNDVSVLVSDSFGGWGLMGRFVGARGLSIGTR